MNNIDRTSYFLEKLKAVKEKYDRLDHLSSIISPIAPDIWEEVQETIETEAATTQPPELPVLFFLLDRRNMENLKSLNQFLGYLRKSSNRKHQEECGQLAYRFQERTDDGYRTAAGALFETDILICLLEKNLEGPVSLYPQIQNGNYPDASFRLGEKTVYLEATILSQTRDQERIGDIAYEQGNPSQEEMENLAVRGVSRHSSFSIVTGVGDPYSDALRITRKVEGKQRQLADESPNILCIGLPDTDPNSLSVEWGINAIFSGDLKPAQLIIRRQKGRLSNDKNLSDIEVQQIENNIQSLEQWEQEFQAEPKLTGVLVFRWKSSGFLLEKQFRNPSSHPDSRLSEEEWQTILDWLAFPKTK